MATITSDSQLANLVPAILDGDLTLTETFFAGLHPHLVAFLHRLCVSPSDIDDLAQDICIKIYRNLHRYDASEPFLPWVRTIARNTVRNHVRDNQRLDDRHAAFGAFVQQRMLCEQRAPSDVGDIRLDYLQRCIRKLNDAHRKLVSLRYTNGMNSDEISEVIGKSPAAIRKTLSRIYDALRQCVQQRTAQEVTS